MIVASLTLIIVFLLLAVMYLSRVVIGKRLWLTSPPTVFCAYFVASSLIGVIIAAADANSFAALAAYALWFGGIVVGLLIIAFIRGNFRNRIETPDPGWALTGNDKIYFFFIALGLISVAITYYMHGRVPLLIGIKSLVSGGSEITMHEARQMNTLHHRSGNTIYFGQGYLRQMYAVVAPIFLGALYLKLKASERNQSKRLIGLLIGTFVLVGALNGQIWVSVHIWLYFLMCIVLVVVGMGQSSVLRIILQRIGLAYLSLVVVIFAYRYMQMLQGRVFDNFVLDTVRRIYHYVQAPLYDIFPDKEPFRYGETWVNDLMGVLPGSIQSFSYEVHHLVHGSKWGFTLSPGIVASSYINFGYVGIIVVSVTLTVVFTLIFVSCSESKSALSVAIGLYLSLQFALGISGDLNNYIVALLTGAIIFATYTVSSKAVKASRRAQAGVLNRPQLGRG